MPLHRRHLLTVIGIASLSGCAPDPTVHLAPTSTAAPSEPTQAPQVAELVAALVTLQQSITNAQDPWRSAASEQVTAWTEQLRRIEPLRQEEPHFPLPSPGVAEDLNQALTGTTVAARQAVDKASGQANRLLQLSILAGLTGLADPGHAPSPGGAGPVQFTDVPPSQVLPAVLSHVLTLLQGLERGIGVLDREDPLSTQATQRRDEVRFLRNHLTAAIGADRPQQDAHYELPTIDPTTFRVVWSGLELAVLGGLLGLAAADDTWRDPAIAQVTKVQAAGGQLPTWPGWDHSA